MIDTFSLAPIRGITDRIFREIFVKHFPGFDSAVAPFIAVTNTHKTDTVLSKEFEKSHKNSIAVVPQILSNNAADFILLAEKLYDYGYPLINWNLGCPYPMVVNKGKGAGLLPYPSRIISFLDKVVPSIQAKLSVKVRLGLRYNDELRELLPFFNQYPLHEIIIHPRTAEQMYTGTVDLAAFEACLEQSTHPIVYNGDITTKALFKKYKNNYPAIKSWMIGRGVLQDPFLITDISGKLHLSPTEKMSTLYSFHNHLLEAYSEQLCGFHQISARMKNIWSYLADCFENSRKIQKQIKKTTNSNKYSRVIATIFKEERLACFAATAEDTKTTHY